MTESVDHRDDGNLHRVPLDSGGHIALHHLPAPGSRKYPVLLVHGSVSNAQSMIDFGHFLVAQGYDCWLLEWGGHGHAKASNAAQNFEAVALDSVPAAINTVLAKTARPRCYWVAHSGGGHLIMMYLCRHPRQQSKLAGCAIIGTQATRYARGARSRMSLCLLWLLTMLCNGTPAWVVKMAGESEPTRLLAQWAGWNIRRRWLGADHFDYLQSMADRWQLALLVVAGAGDRIAPASGCYEIFQSIRHPDKHWLLCGVEQGFSRDFTHGQLVRGSAARAEIYPRVVHWLNGKRRRDG